MAEWTHLDTQMGRWGGRLRDDVLVSPGDCVRLASAMAAEMGAAPEATLRGLKDASPVPLRVRLDELVAYQAFADLTNGELHPALVRARVITQCYVCFVYLKDRWFYSLAQEFPEASTVARVARYLTNGRVRSFRNAFSHGNWRYAEDFSGLEFWDRGFSAPDKVSQEDMDFWQSVSRCAAYVTIRASVHRAA